MAESLHFPAEWESQSAVLLAWPNARTDWRERLVEIDTVYVALSAAITRFQTVIICVADERLRTHVEARLRSTQVDLSRVLYFITEYDDTWLRDSGPVSLCGDGQFRWLDFRFTGWGGKFEGSKDDRLPTALAQSGLFRSLEHQSIDFALEGGAIETDGNGTLLTTWRCLHQRHPHATRSQLDQRLRELLAQDRVLWLERGYLEGDDTDAHIDTLARFADPDTIVYQGCDQKTDDHYMELSAMADELKTLRTRSNRPYRLIELPWPAPIWDNGRRLAASYANFLIINGAVLMPAYGDSADTEAMRVLESAFPQREILPIPCRPLIWQNGSLHCITMQLPFGLLAPA